MFDLTASLKCIDTTAVPDIIDVKLPFLNGL